MNERTGLSRRVLLKRTVQAATAAVTVPYFVPARAFGANEKIQLGVIGNGGRAQHLLGFTPKHRCAFVGFSDLHDARMKSTRAKFNKDGAMYRNYHDMLASDDVDAVYVATP
ncbi:MAG: hypothetical protein GY851_36305, partial [bacterium]|nr:hypothetical protein [bacterium]